MKKFLVVLGVCLFAFAFVAGDLLAYQEAFNVSGHRTQSRNATTATIDAAYYNPVGLVKMQDGLYVDLGNRILSLTTTNEVDRTLAAPALGREAESKTMTYLLPNFAVAYKVGAGAVFYTFDIREGGAGGTWDDAESIDVIAGFGVPNSASALFTKIEATTFTFGHTLGVSYKINDMFAVGAGMRYFKKIQDATFDLTAVGAGTGLLAEERHSSWEGYTGLVGLLVSPMNELNISLQFQGKVLKYGREEVQGSPATATAYSLETSASNSPSIFLLGVAYKVMPELEVMFSYNREFTAEKKIGGSYELYDEKDTDKQVFGLGAEYTVMQGLLVSAGVSYKLTGTDDVNNTATNDPSFNEIDLGLGGVYTVMPGLNVELGVAYNIYKESKDGAALSATHPSADKYNRSAWVVGLGVTYKAL